MSTQKVRLLVAYKGTDFHGFAEQPSGIPTVAGRLRAALERVLRQTLVLTCAGRTDTGVHATGQVVSFEADLGSVEPSYLQRAVNKQVGPNIVVKEAAVVAPEFDARHSATMRTYRYDVLNAAVADPLRADVAWWLPDTLDVVAMNTAASAIVGEHDFSSFCRRPDPDATLVRRILSAQWTSVPDDVLRFEVKANAFCHQMIRSLVGHMVEIGKGRRPSEDMSTTLAAMDRSRAATLAPPQGLVLAAVEY